MQREQEEDRIDKSIFFKIIHEASHSCMHMNRIYVYMNVILYATVATVPNIIIIPGII
jgi:hypothetical protein